jgi:hypothetical protein
LSCNFVGSGYSGFQCEDGQQRGLSRQYYDCWVASLIRFALGVRKIFGNLGWCRAWSGGSIFAKPNHFIKRKLCDGVRMRPVPELRFEVTNAIAHGNDLIELLDGIAEAEV